MRIGLIPAKGRRSLALSALVLIAGVMLVWLSGGLHAIEAMAVDAQRIVQNRLAGAVRAIRAGEPWALAGLLALCFAYGFAHAVGPGHGKFLIGGYGVARRVGFRRLAGIAVLTAMAQAAVAVAMVHAALWLLGWSREQMVGAAEGVLAAASSIAIGAIGLCLMVRGGRQLWRQARHGDHHPAGQHGHHGPDSHHPDSYHHGPECGCGHDHAPAPEAVERATGWRDTLALVAGVAIRPCSGALFLLIVTWQMGIAAAGIAGTFAMGAGVAAVTVAVAGLAVWSREGALVLVPDQRLAQVLPVIELLAGATIAVLALGIVSQTV